MTSLKNIALIGGTGSIGTQVIDCVLRHSDRFKITAIAAGSNVSELVRQVKLTGAEYCAIADDKGLTALKQGVSCACGGGFDAVLDCASYSNADVVFVAVSGFKGLEITKRAIEAGKTVALANKETLVVGGDLIMPLARAKGVTIIPVDSEHSALWQALSFNTRAHYKRLIITASGGAFYGYSAESLKTVTPQEALRHPNWNMGAKITIDSATLLNKGYEVIEAKQLYNADYSQISTVIHRESIIHSMVEFDDGAIMAQLSYPDMRIPIQLALTYPDRLDAGVDFINFNKLSALHFAPLERKDYPCYDLALAAGEAGGIMPCVLNAAGEEAVAAFLSGRLAFTDIARVIGEVVSSYTNTAADCFEIYKSFDAEARIRAAKYIIKLQNIV